MTNPFNEGGIGDALDGAFGDKADDAIEAGGDFLNEKTGGRFEDQIQQGQDALSDQFGGAPDDSDAGSGDGGFGAESGGDIESGGNDS